jgi:hypothetical protein
VLCVLAALLAPAPALASATQESLVEDERLMLQAGPVARAQALDDVAALGADGVRAVVRWRDIAPAPNRERRPAGFEPADPAAYPAGSWDALDDLVRGTRARGLFLLLSPSTPLPAWASRCDGTATRRRVCRPDPREYGAFVRALGRRYGGAYTDGDGEILPRVRRWSLGNEPNQPAWLRPQLVRHRGITYPESAVVYRSLARAGIAALRATGHLTDQLLLGETSPIGQTTGALARRPASPGSFIRTLLCIDRRGRALRGRAATVRDCRGFTRLGVTGFAHHPYAQGGSRPPTFRGRPATEIALASTDRLERLLDAAARRDRIPARLPIHFTEHGYQTNPPDTALGVPLDSQAAYINQSDWIAYRNPRVQTVAQYKLADDPVVSGFQSGLRFSDGGLKPSYAAYRMPVWVSARGAARLRVYGQLRPLPRGAPARVELQNASLGDGAFTTIAMFAVRSPNGTFLRTIPRFEGRFRLRWTPPGGAPLLSRSALIARG